MNIVEPIRRKRDLRKIESLLRRKSRRDLLLFVMGINTGLRVSDILALNVKDVKNKEYIDIIERKTGKSKRFPINDRIKAMLKVYTSNKEMNQPLFQTVYKNRLERTNAYRIINRVCKKVGVEGHFGTHTLRKTFGYHHYNKYKDIALLQKIFNHYSPSVTLRYIGIDQEVINESYRRFIL